MKKNAVFTVAEAERNWCPFVGPQRFDRQSECCDGPRCMAWRWHTTNVLDPDALNNFGEKPGTKEVSDVYGYCGLAGQP